MSEAEATESSNGAGPVGGEAAAGEERLRLGGMALRNGLLVHGPRAWAVAARTADGRIDLASGPKPVLARGRLGQIPMLRGPLRLAEALAVVPVARARLPGARLAFEDRGVLVAALVSLFASAALRRSRAREPEGGGSAWREAAVATLGVLPALTALRDHDLAAYHGVEHKAIGGYEVGADPADVPKEHQRCGSNLILPMLALSATGQLAVDRLVPRPGPISRGLATLAGIGAAVELFVYAERHPDSAVGRAIHGPGHEIQRRLSTREPTAEQLEVGEAALQALLRAEAAAADTV